MTRKTACKKKGSESQAISLLASIKVSVKKFFYLKNSNIPL